MQKVQKEIQAVGADGPKGETGIQADKVLQVQKVQQQVVDKVLKVIQLQVIKVQLQSR